MEWDLNTVDDYGEEFEFSAPPTTDDFEFVGEDNLGEGDLYGYDSPDYETIGENLGYNDYGNEYYDEYAGEPGYVDMEYDTNGGAYGDDYVGDGYVGDGYVAEGYGDGYVDSYGDGYAGEGYLEETYGEGYAGDGYPEAEYYEDATGGLY